MSDQHHVVTLVRRPLSEVSRIYSEQTDNLGLKLGLLILADEIKKLEDKVKQLEQKYSDELWKDTK